MKVARLPRDPGPAGWNELLPPAPPAKPLDGEVRAEWAVVGAGFAGLAAARRLSQLCPEDRIVLLDATRIGAGPAGRNTGFMIDLPHDLSSRDYGGDANRDRTTIEDNRRAIAFAARMVSDFGLPREAFDPCGKVNAASSRAGHQHNLDHAAHLSALDEPHEMLDAAQMKHLTGSDYYRSGLRTAGTVMLQPAMYVRGVADGLRSNRVTLHEISPVTDLSRDGASWRLTTPDGTLRADRVILTVNGHLQSFGFQPGRLIHTHTYASMTRPMTQDEVARLGGAPRWGVTPADPLGTTVRRISGTGGDRIVIRNHFTYDPGIEPRDGWEARVMRLHDTAFAARFPMLPGMDMTHRWGGRLCLSLNGAQVVEEVEPGLFAGCCQNGLGTVRGTLAGLLAAELACGLSSPALDRVQGLRPSRLPPAPLATIGARARLRWGEWRAGREF